MMNQMGDGMLGNGMMYGMGIGMLTFVVLVFGLGFLAGYFVAKQN